MPSKCCDPCRGTCNLDTTDFTGLTPGDPPPGHLVIVSNTWQIGTGENLSGTGNGARINYNYAAAYSSPLKEANQVAANSLVFDFYAEDGDVFTVGPFDDGKDLQFTVAAGGSGGSSSVALIDASGNTLIVENTDGDAEDWNTVLVCWAESPRNSTDAILVYRLHVTVNGTEAFGYYIAVDRGNDPDEALFLSNVGGFELVTASADLFFDDIAISKPDATQVNCPECEDDGTVCTNHGGTLENEITLSLYFGFNAAENQWFEGEYTLLHGSAFIDDNLQDPGDPPPNLSTQNNSCSRVYYAYRQLSYASCPTMRQWLAILYNAETGALQIDLIYKTFTNAMLLSVQLYYNVPAGGGTTRTATYSHQISYGGDGPGCGGGPMYNEPDFPSPPATIDLAFSW